MEKNEKRTYLSPETEVVRFNADIITTSLVDNNGSMVEDDDVVTYTEPDPFN